MTTAERIARLEEVGESLFDQAIGAHGEELEEIQRLLDVNDDEIMFQIENYDRITA